MLELLGLRDRPRRGGLGIVLRLQRKRPRPTSIVGKSAGLTLASTLSVCLVQFFLFGPPERSRLGFPVAISRFCPVPVDSLPIPLLPSAVAFAHDLDVRPSSGCNPTGRARAHFARERRWPSSLRCSFIGPNRRDPASKTWGSLAGPPPSEAGGKALGKPPQPFRPWALAASRTRGSQNRPEPAPGSMLDECPVTFKPERELAQLLQADPSGAAAKAVCRTNSLRVISARASTGHPVAGNQSASKRSQPQHCSSSHTIHPHHP